MTKKKKIATTQAWEDGTLGRDEAFAARAPSELVQQVDDVLGLQMISIRLSKELIQDFKMIAQVHGVGYQPLMRDALTRFAAAELKKMAIQYANEKAEKAAKPQLQADNANDGDTAGNAPESRKRRVRKAA